MQLKSIILRTSSWNSRLIICSIIITNKFFKLLKRLGSYWEIYDYNMLIFNPADVKTLNYEIEYNI